MKKIAVLQSNYIPWRGYFDIINKVDVFVVYDEVQFTTRDWRNRNIIKTASGPKWLTIPVRHESLQQKICETRVSSAERVPWNVKHWKILKEHYSKAPFFKTYSKTFEDIYLGMDTDLLSEINLKFLRAVNDILGITTPLVDSRSLNLRGDKNQRLVQAVTKLGGTHYLSGPAARDYLDVGLFDAHNVEVEWMDYSGYKEYPQLHPPFYPAVSILDAIFNCGPNVLPEFRKCKQKLFHDPDAVSKQIKEKREGDLTHV